MTGIVWGKTKIKANEKLELIIKNYKQYKNIKPIQVKKTYGELSAIFDNGEKWYAFDANENRRGLCCEVSLIDKEIDEKVKECIILPCTKSFSWTAIGYY